MGYIYKITNDINDKIYIGQTTRSIKVRWDAHINRANNGDKEMHICSAIKKYGAEHFNIEKIEECENDILDNREIYWIEYFNSYRCGYNSTIGGGGGSKYNHNKIVDLWNSGYDLKKISEICKCSVETVRSHIYTIDGVQEQLVSIKYINMGTPISQYTLLGDYIKTFPTIQDATREMGFGKSTLGSSLFNGYATCGGFQWRYGDSTKNIGLAKGSRKAVVQLTPEGEYIKIYISLAEAERDTGVCHSNISKGCRTGYKYGGYRWMYYQDWEEENGKAVQHWEVHDIPEETIENE